MASVTFKNVYKIYNEGVKGKEFQAVKDCNMEIKDREFVVFVGPSGCGKTTTLRMLAGLEEISKGEIIIGETVVNNLEPKHRDIAMVFQNYALYPHMSVFENMSYALKLQKVSKKEREEKVNEAAAILGLENLLSRKPKELSGGQRQRVALGRAIVRHPKVFLMDEPLSNLDAKLRVQTRAEIIKLHKKLNTTFIYVTHDQTEAMTMGERIVIMKEGVIQQFDTPENVYFNPINLFVAGFIGSPQMNFVDGVVSKRDGVYYLNMLSNNYVLDNEYGIRLEEKGILDKTITIGIRPEHIYDSTRRTDMSFVANVELMEMLGSEKYLHLQIDGVSQKILAKIFSDNPVTSSDKIELFIDSSKLHFFDKQTEMSLLY